LKNLKIVILANGLPPEALCREVITGSEFLIAADGGSKIALRYRLKLDCVIGDLDSLRPGSWRHYRR
jgi:thiamine pyrophosphokinase